LRADSALVLHHALTSDVAIELAALVIPNRGELARQGRSRIDSEATPSVVQIDEYAAIFRDNCFQRLRYNFPAIATCGCEDVSG
jgi:AAA+ superfamily predicted ATPase